MIAYVDDRLKEIIQNVCTESRAELLRLEVMPDHVHLLVEVDPQYGIHRLVRAIKGRSSRLLRQEYPWLKSRCLPSGRTPILSLPLVARLWKSSSNTSKIRNGCKMIQRQLKLRLNSAQEAHLQAWLFHLTGVWNWAIRKIEQDAKDGIYYSQKAFHNLLADHGKKLGIPSHTLQGMLDTAYTAWQRCYKKLAKRPRLKGQRNKLTSIPFPDPFKGTAGTRIHLPGIGHVRFHAQDLPQGRIKSGRIVKRASGWYLCLCIDAHPQSIPHTGHSAIGIDPGFHHLLTLSTGEKIPHPHELRQTAHRLAQAQRGSRKQLTARLHERLANQRKDRNHKLSRRLVAENHQVVWSKDRQPALAKVFGKSVASAGHAQLRGMLAYKCTASGREFLEVPSQHSTKTCSACGSLSGPTGYAGLSVRQWTCSACGAVHDRDVNAAVNTLIVGVGITLEYRRKAVPGIPCL